MFTSFRKCNHRFAFVQLDKVYPNGSDLNERFEEMNRMREEAYREYDKDGDHLISLAEFLEYSKVHLAAFSPHFSCASRAFFSSLRKCQIF